MSDDQTRRKVRKGTKSCTECRRRKVRCIRTSEDAATCQKCEERGSKCVAQIYSRSRPHQAQRLPSRHRMSQLESKVAILSKAVSDLESKLGHQPPGATELEEGPSSGVDDSDDDSSIVEIPTAEQPSHLHSLFQNDWLSVDTRQQAEQLQDHKSKTSAHLLDMAKQALQKLIPPKDEFSDIASSSSSKWLVLLRTLFPQPFTFNSQQEMLNNYDDMHKPDIDSLRLATWLLLVAITAQQEYGSPHTQLSRYQRSFSFSRAVSNTVESTILSHDRLVGTIQGLGVALNFVRLQVSLGNFQKAWVRLRHFIAIAELMGLPRAVQAVQLNRIKGADEDERQSQRAQLWESICLADRIFAMILNLPPGTRGYQQTHHGELIISGVVQPRAYLRRLTDITIKLQGLDDINTTQGFKAEFYASALNIDRELKELASQTPKSWWAMDGEDVKADHIIQFLHLCTSIRVHLPFTMRQDPEEEYIYNRLACMDACKSVAQRYQFLRERLLPGIFLSRMLDLQAFTATVILLLTSHGTSPMDRLNVRSNKPQIDSIVAQVVKLLDEKSNDVAGSDFARQGVAAIRSLHTLLQQDDNARHVQELTLKVPLLGNVRVRRNIGTTQASKASNPWIPQTPPESGLWKPNGQVIPQQSGHLPLPDDALVEPALQPQGEWQWDPLSWFVEDHGENFFQDTLMMEDLDQFDMAEDLYFG